MNPSDPVVFELDEVRVIIEHNIPIRPGSIVRDNPRATELLEERRVLILRLDEVEDELGRIVSPETP